MRIRGYLLHYCNKNNSAGFVFGISSRILGYLRVLSVRLVLKAFACSWYIFVDSRCLALFCSFGITDNTIFANVPLLPNVSCISEMTKILFFQIVRADLEEPECCLPSICSLLLQPCFCVLLITVIFFPSSPNCQNKQSVYLF